VAEMSNRISYDLSGPSDLHRTVIIVYLGYVEMLEVLADPDHERHADMREWLGEEVDPFRLQAAAPESRPRRTQVPKSHHQETAIRLSRGDRSRVTPSAYAEP
jgi:hypothetical protein